MLDSRKAPTRQETGTYTFGQPFGTTNQITATGYQYDLAGHLTNDGLGNTYSYDAEGKMSASNGALYTRDPFGQRVRKDFSGAATEYYYFGGTLLATRNPTSAQWTDYIYAGGRLIAEIPVTSTDTAFYRIGDHLDSLAQKTDSTGNLLGTNDLSPWGELIDSSAEDRLLFTQHERDMENNSDSTLYRQYASDQGRWLSPDPSNGSYNLYDPQSFNRYAYLGNRPHNATDPLGLVGEGCGILCTIAIDAGGAALIGGIEGLFGGSPHLPGEQTNPSAADTSAADSGLPGDTVGQPDWDQPVLNEHLGLPPTIAAQLGSGGLLGAVGLGTDTCEFGACLGGGFSFQQPGQTSQNDNGPQYPYTPPWLPQNRNAQGPKPGPPTRAPSPRSVPDPRQNPGAPVDEPPPTNSGRFWYSLMQILRAIHNDIGLPGGVPIMVDPCRLDPLESFCSRRPTPSL
jgi:RHS repeat-associated protein